MLRSSSLRQEAGQLRTEERNAQPVSFRAQEDSLRERERARERERKKEKRNKQTKKDRKRERKKEKPKATENREL